ncbi:unnamed protein product [Amaranthus hypochondriacus]
MEHNSDHKAPEIKVRMADNGDVMINITFKMKKGILCTIINEVEQRHLFINSINSMPFTDQLSIFSIVAKKEPDFALTQQDLVDQLHSLFQ